MHTGTRRVHAPRGRQAGFRSPYMGGINNPWTARRMCTGQGCKFFDKDKCCCKFCFPVCTVCTADGVGA